MFPQLSGHTCCIFPEETNQLQPPHQSQQSVHHLSRDGWNQPDPPYWLWERPASVLAIGASQWGPGQHEQCSRGSLVFEVNSMNGLFSKVIDFWHYKVILASTTVCTQYSKNYDRSLNLWFHLICFSCSFLNLFCHLILGHQAGWRKAVELWCALMIMKCFAYIHMTTDDRKVSEDSFSLLKQCYGVMWTLQLLCGWKWLWMLK